MLDRVPDLYDLCFNQDGYVLPAGFARRFLKLHRGNSRAAQSHWEQVVALVGDTDAVDADAAPAKMTRQAVAAAATLLDGAEGRCALCCGSGPTGLPDNRARGSFQELGVRLLAVAFGEMPDETVEEMALAVATKVLPDFRRLASWKLHEGTAINALNFIRDKNTQAVKLAVADARGRISLCDIGLSRPDAAPACTLLDNRGGVVYDMTHLPAAVSAWPFLVAVGDDGRATEYDVEKQIRRSLSSRLRRMTIRAVDFHLRPDGSTVVAVGGKDDRVYLLEGDSDEVRTLKGVKGAVRALRMLRRENWLAAAHGGGVTLWDIDAVDGRPVGQVGDGECRSIAAYYDGLGRPRLALASDHGIQIWDPVARLKLTEFARQFGVTVVVALSALDGDPQLASAIGDRVSLWSPATEYETPLVRRYAGQVTALAKILAGNGNTLLAAADNNGCVELWELATVRPTAEVAGTHDDWVNALAVVGDTGRYPLETLVASASDDRSIKLWRIDHAMPAETLTGHQAQAQALAVIPRPPSGPWQGKSGDLLASADENGRILLWDLSSQSRLRHAIGSDTERVRALAACYLADEQGERWPRLVSAGGSGRLKIWDPLSATGDPIGEIVYGPSLVRALATVEVDGDVLLAAGGSDGRIVVWDIRAPARPRWAALGHTGQVRVLTVVRAAELTLLASGGSDGRICLWDWRGGAGKAQPLRAFVSHHGQVAALTAIQRTDRLISGGADRAIRTWDVKALLDNGQTDVVALAEVPNAHVNWVRALCAHPPNGSLLVSGGDDGSVRLWDIGGGIVRRLQHRVTIRGFGDRPARKDLLDRRTVAQVIGDLLKEPSGEDLGFAATTGPRVVSVEGEWGSGKTSVMRMVQEWLEPPVSTVDFLRGWGRLRRALSRAWHADHLTPRRAVAVTRRGTTTGVRSGGTARRRTVFPFLFARWRARWRASRRARVQSLPGDAAVRVITAWFNPWAHQSHDQVWAGLARTIIDAAGPAVGADRREQQEYWFRCNVERMDGAELRRTIRRRFLRPSVQVAIAIVPAVAVSLLTKPVSVDALRAGAVVAAVLAVIAWGYALYRYCRGPAAAYLPAELFVGPVLSGAFATATGPDKELYDPLYRAKSGQLYLVQHDIDRLAEDLKERGYQLVVFVDDLDRCTENTTADIFEAINVFLSKRFSNTRFVIGLDPGVVAHRLNHKYLAAAPEAALPYPDDPHAGWAFMRKLCQLPVTLPKIRETHTTRLLKYHTPDSRQDQDAVAPATPDPVAAHPPELAPADAVPVNHPGEDRSRPVQQLAAPDGRRPARTDVASAGTRDLRELHEAPDEEAAERLSLEGDPAVRAHLRQLIRLRPRQSVRETKRLLTVWGFYMRTLQTLLPADQTTTAGAACNVLTFAEIVTRWPAFVPAFGPTADGDSGLRALIIAAQQHPSSPPDRRLWLAALKQLGLDREEYRTATSNLRELLRLHGNLAVAEFAEIML